MYYLRNFQIALDSITRRYADLLDAPERAFIGTFAALPRPSQALLVRLIMRKGPLFRRSRLIYPEIGDIDAALQPLIEVHWIDPKPALTLAQLFKLSTRKELAKIFGIAPSGATKASLQQSLREQHAQPLPLHQWRPDEEDSVLCVAATSLCTRLRLLFFGNFHQEWSQFVLADLGIFKYETVDLCADSRAFENRTDVEHCYLLYECRRQFYADVALDEVLGAMPSGPLDHLWLEGRRAKLLFQIAMQYERRGDPTTASRLYLASTHRGARLRAIRSMEMARQFGEAKRLLDRAAASPRDDAERQCLPRIQRRLDRRLGNAIIPAQRPKEPDRLTLEIRRPHAGISVEIAVIEQLSSANAPVYYVENSLINSLFGLLCWQAIFAPVRGAFFHAFHAHPADLYTECFHSRRRELFEKCLLRLDTDDHHASIRTNYRDKYGTQSPFVNWDALGEGLLETALQCIPGPHLRRYFERLLLDLRQNCSGFPDLIQFWPQQQRYRMIEVKGPGDRLQDNQRRWIEFCTEHQFPVTVCTVTWS